MLAELKIDQSSFAAIYFDAYNREKPFYRLPKREASLMVMSESYAAQAKLSDRMLQLKGRTLSGAPPQGGAAGCRNLPQVTATVFTATIFRRFFCCARIRARTPVMGQETRCHPTVT